jgi:hypothetical protein
MTDFVIVCTGRNTHPQTVADVAGLTSDPARSVADLMADAVLGAMTQPRRKITSPRAEFTCPACGQRRPLGIRRMRQLVTAFSDLRHEETAQFGRPLPGLAPIDLSFM